MFIGIVYFIVIILANTVGAISGMGGGVIIKPVFDAIGAHPLVSISFYSTVAVFTMSIISTMRQAKNGIKIKLNLALFVSLGSIIGGAAGNTAFERLLGIFDKESTVQWIQIILTIISLVFAFIYTKANIKSLGLKSLGWYFITGLFLGFLASLLGIGGGPINVALLMLCFGMKVKEATVYSIITIFFSQISKLISIGVSTGYGIFDLKLLIAIIPAAILGGFVGAKLSGVLLDKAVLKVYQAVVLLVIFLNIANGIRLN